MHKFDDRELATVLAALRWYQSTGLSPFVYDDHTAAIHDIATAGGTVKPLSENNIDALCERLNTEADDLGPIAVSLEGGLVTGVASDDKRLHGIEAIVIDYDSDTGDEGAERDMIAVPQRDIRTGKVTHDTRAIVHSDGICRAASIDLAETTRRMIARAIARADAGAEA